MTIGYIIRQAIAALLLPLCIAAALAFGDMMNGQQGEQVKGINTFLALLLGAGAYTIIFTFLHRSVLRAFFDRGPVQSMWGTITGYHLPDASRQGGQQAEIPVDAKGRRVPLWATMAPYAFPIYTMIGVLVVWLVKYVTGMSWSYYSVIMGAVIGFTYATHVFMVGSDIRSRQPALRSAGTAFTLALMFLFNIQVLAALAMLVFDANWIEFNEDILRGVQGQYEWFYEHTMGLIK